MLLSVSNRPTKWLWNSYDGYERVHFLRTKNDRRDAIAVIDKESYIEYLTDYVRLIESGQRFSQ